MDFIESVKGKLVQSEAHTRKDRPGRGSSASLDHIITWNLTSGDMAEVPRSKVHWVGSERNDHALISCTVGGNLLAYQDPEDRAQNGGGRAGEVKLKKIDPR